MKKKIFLSLLVVVGLFMISGCNLASQEEQNKQEPKQADQHSLNNGDQTPTNDDENQPTDDEPQDDTSEENLAKRLIGKWKYENSETGVIDINTLNKALLYKSSVRYQTYFAHAKLSHYCGIIYC